ncbi:MAG: TPM domain-containing protein [Betaproteobacteria bacterium]
MTAVRRLLCTAAAALAMAAVGVVGGALLGFPTASFAVTWEPGKDGLRPIPPLTGRVVDLTNTLSASERQSLESKLAAWEARTTNQLAVIVVPTTAPESIDEFGIRVGEAWKIGQKGEDNGAIIIVAKDDKRLRIEVGYGFEGVLTDVTSRRIIAENVAPLFSQGKFAAGIDAGVDRIITVVDDGKPLPPPGKAARKPRSGNIDFGTLFIVLLVAVPVVGGILRSMLGNVAGSLAGGGIAGVAAWFVAGSMLIAGIAGVVAFFIILFSILGGRGGWIPMGGGGGGGGFGGGGGGGFSGGGGGFGGGGASGGWN